MSPFLSAAICASVEDPESLERSCGAAKVAPASWERVQKIFVRPGVSSSQLRSIAPVESTISHALREFPKLLERLEGAEKVGPLSHAGVKNRSLLLASAATFSSQTA